METIVSKSALSNAVKNLSQVLNKKNALPILGDLRFEVSGDDMKITASDGETTLQQKIEILKHDTDGKFCVNAKLLKDSLKNIPEQPITLEANETNNTFKVHHQKGEIFFPMECADEYPMPARPKLDWKLTVNSTEVIDAIKRCIWTTANDELRPIMEGVFFDVDGDGLTIVASDGHCIVKTEIFVSANFKGGFIISKKAANILSKHPKGTELNISYNTQWVRIESEYMKIYSRLIEGKYPKYNSVIPSDWECIYNAELYRESLINSVERIIPFAYDNGYKKVVLRFGAEKENRLKISGEDFDMSTGASDVIPIESFEGDALTIGAMGARLVKMLRNLNSMCVTFYLYGPNKAFVIKETDASDDEPVVTMLAMPLFIDD